MTAQKFYIECYGQDFLLVNNDVLKCSADVEQACYTRATGDKGCTRLENCSRDGWLQFGGSGRVRRSLKCLDLNVLMKRIRDALLQIRKH
ncbi:hypothetical protein JOB18_044202 [Solea senegalensis]|uniref:Uncharacterized protein n=1 Tax=Solea senegalensis TaxID=28829 RepID=A0AAV6S4Q4_SOLSE|nr:hypothetical protein JOB18_044202 [Solea senegalensis]